MLGALARFSLGVAALVMTLVAPASAQSVADIIKRGKIAIAIDTANPPFAAVGANGQPEGYEAEVATLLGKALGVQVELVPATVQNRIAYLVSGQVDLIMIGITTERAKTIWFSNPYASDGAVLVGLANVNVKSIADLADKRIAVARGAMQDIVLTPTAPRGANIMRFDDQATSIQALISGQVDLAGASMLAYQVLNRDDSNKKYETKLLLRPLHFGFGMKPGNAELLKWINTFVYSIKENGDLEAISQKWRKLPVGPLPTF